MEVNGESAEGITHEDAVQMLQSDPDKVTLLVSRLIDPDESQLDIDGEILEIEFQKSDELGLGFSMAGGTDGQIEVSK